MSSVQFEMFKPMITNQFIGYETTDKLTDETLEKFSFINDTIPIVIIFFYFYDDVNIS